MKTLEPTDAVHALLKQSAGVGSPSSPVDYFEAQLRQTMERRRAWAERVRRKRQEHPWVKGVSLDSVELIRQDRNR